jgi:glycosyltransferase involved in cell wall biosynthesis
VHVTGWVPDTRPYLDKAEIFVAPLRIARGVQNKLLEALAMGLPSVCTRLAWRGTGVSEGKGILVADDAEELAGLVIRLFQDTTFREEMAQQARAAAEASFRWETQLAALDHVITTVTRRSMEQPALYPARD